jgi:hypothetical protein
VNTPVIEEGVFVPGATAVSKASPSPARRSIVGVVGRSYPT